MTHFHPNFEPIALIVSLSSVLLAFGFYITIFFEINLFLGTFLIITAVLWAITVVLLIGYSSRSLYIKNNEIGFTKFGRVTNKRSIRDLIEIREELGVWPISFHFNDNTVIHTSGFVTGKSHDLFAVISRINPDIKISKYNKN